MSLKQHLLICGCSLIDLNLSSCLVSCWSASLDNAMQHHTGKSMKHWFSIYQMIEKYRQEQEEKKNEGSYFQLFMF